ncbi:hypothetical protein OIU84_013424 [Salix udensis]|uniref:Uncharacterized protein n=1 Tax=Salix udensis TaxID=889485 RepID=A0AAD6JJ85_9ROSI|nr:hypothetical protein OIU84_013424 [Salix udensis]
MSISMSLFPPPPTHLPPSFSSKHHFNLKPTLSIRHTNPPFLLSTFKACIDDGGTEVSAFAATLEGSKSEQKEPEASESVPVAEENSNGVVASGGGVKVAVSKFEDPRWISGTWDLKQLEKDGKTDWDAVIFAFSCINAWREPAIGFKLMLESQF